MHHSMTAAHIAASHSGHVNPWVAAHALALVPFVRLNSRVARNRRRFLRWEDHRFDRALGIDTSGFARPSAAGVIDGDATEGFVYRAQPVRLTRWLLRHLPASSRDFTFVEMGSGEGRACVLAAEAGFRRIEGIEFQHRPHEQAVRNVAALKSHGHYPHATIKPRLQDAATYEFPPEDPLVVHFANPFSERVMSRVIDHLSDSYALRPRPVFAVYLEPRNESHPTHTRNAELLAQLPMFSDTRPLAYAGPTEGFLLGPWQAFICQTPEAAELHRWRAAQRVRPLLSSS